MKTVVRKVVLLKLPVAALIVPGPSWSGDQLMVIGLTSLKIVPPVELPTKVPVAPSVRSVTIKLKLKAAKEDPMPTACVVQTGQTRVKLPRLTLDGTPVAMFMSGMNVRVAALPEVLLSMRLEPENPVPIALVLKVIVAAASCIDSATETMAKMRTKMVFKYLSLSLTFPNVEPPVRWLAVPAWEVWTDDGHADALLGRGLGGPT